MGVSIHNIANLQKQAAIAGTSPLTCLGGEIKDGTLFVRELAKLQVDAVGARLLRRSAARAHRRATTGLPQGAAFTSQEYLGLYPVVERLKSTDGVERPIVTRGAGSRTYLDVVSFRAGASAFKSY